MSNLNMVYCGDVHSVQRTTVVSNAKVTTDHTMFSDGVRSTATDLIELMSQPPDAVVGGPNSVS